MEQRIVVMAMGGISTSQGCYGKVINGRIVALPIKSGQNLLKKQFRQLRLTALL